MITGKICKKEDQTWLQDIVNASCQEVTVFSLLTPSQTLDNLCQRLINKLKFTLLYYNSFRRWAIFPYKYFKTWVFTHRVHATNYRKSEHIETDSTHHLFELLESKRPRSWRPEPHDQLPEHGRRTHQTFCAEPGSFPLPQKISSKDEIFLALVNSKPGSVSPSKVSLNGMIIYLSPQTSKRA